MSSALWCVLNGRAAAPPAIECSVGPSTSTKPRAASVSRIDCTILRAVEEPRQHAFAVRQVEIPHPLPQLGIGAGRDAFPAAARALLVRKCSCSAKIVSSPVLVRRSSPSTPMMSPRSKHSASCPVVADLLLADEELDLAGPVADVDEHQLALVALQHDAAGGADLRADHFAGALLGEPLAEVEALAGGCRRSGSATSRPSAVR